MPNDERGSVFVEYTVLLVLVSLACVAAMLALGAPLLRLVQVQRAVLLCPFVP